MTNDYLDNAPRYCWIFRNLPISVCTTSPCFLQFFSICCTLLPDSKWLWISVRCGSRTR